MPWRGPDLLLLPLILSSLCLPLSHGPVLKSEGPSQRGRRPSKRLGKAEPGPIGEGDFFRGGLRGHERAPWGKKKKKKRATRPV